LLSIRVPDSLRQALGLRTLPQRFRASTWPDDPCIALISTFWPPAPGGFVALRKVASVNLNWKKKIIGRETNRSWQEAHACAALIELFPDNPATINIAVSNLSNAVASDDDGKATMLIYLLARKFKGSETIQAMLKDFANDDSILSQIRTSALDVLIKYCGLARDEKLIESVKQLASTRIDEYRLKSIILDNYPELHDLIEKRRR
jgi:hypothetical protein